MKLAPDRDEMWVTGPTGIKVLSRDVCLRQCLRLFEPSFSFAV